MKLVFIFLIIFSLSLQSIAFVKKQNLKVFHIDFCQDNHTLQQLNQKQSKQFLNVHLVAHSHFEYGWRKNYDQYYYGSDQNNHFAGAQYTFDSIVISLLDSQDKKFNLAEVGFFYRWWNQQKDDMKNKVRLLIKNKQISFNNGGWSMSDEATAYYEDIIDQMTLGHQFLQENFDVIPSTGWQIDSYGHSNTMAALFSQMGFNTMFFARIDYQDRQIRLKENNMEFIWHPKQISGIDNYIFSHINYFHYESPPDFCFDESYCYDDPIMDDTNFETVNIQNKSDQFVNYFKMMSLHYKNNHLMHTIGSDFQYQNSLMNFKNMDKLINYINNHSKEYNIKFQYSTPEEYIQSINNQSQVYKTNVDDFLPYCDNVSSFWTGFYTSRSNLKAQIFELGRYLQSTRNLVQFLRINGRSLFMSKNQEKINKAQRFFEQTMAVMQNHDTIAGTLKQQSANDFIQLMNSALNIYNQDVIFSLLNEHSKQENKENILFLECTVKSGYELCGQTKNNLNNGKNIILAIYNPSLETEYVAKVSVINSLYDVLDNTNTNINNEIICANQTDANDCYLFFKTYLKGFSINYYKIIKNQQSKSSNLLQGERIKIQDSKKKVDLYNNRTIYLSSLHNVIKHVYCQTIEKCEEDVFGVEINIYHSFQRISEFDQRQVSGVYIFRPQNEEYIPPIRYSTILKKVIYKGSIITLVHFLGDKSESFFKFYNILGQEKVIEIQTYLYPIDILEDSLGKEVVMDIQTNLNNDNKFYTDSNGLEMQERIVNQRPTWKLNITEPTSGNYYPITRMIQIKDKNSSKIYTIVTDRPQGGTCLEQGKIEIMLHRRNIYDDQRGLNQSLNETDYDNNGLRVSTTHYIILGNSDNNKDLPRLIQKNLDTNPIVFVGISYFNKFYTKDTHIQSLIPKNFETQDPFLKIYLQNLNSDMYIFRLHNMNENRNAYFQHQFSYLEEMTLTANQAKKQWKQNQMKWKQEGLKQKDFRESISISSNGTITLLPMEIRTFKVQIPCIFNEH